MVLISCAPVRGAEICVQIWGLRSGKEKGWWEALPRGWLDLT